LAGGWPTQGHHGRVTASPLRLTVDGEWVDGCLTRAKSPQPGFFKIFMSDLICYKVFAGLWLQGSRKIFLFFYDGLSGVRY